MKFNKSFAIQDSARKRELSQPDKGHPSQASKCQGITGVETPLKTTQAMQSLPFLPCKVKFEDPLPKINEKHDTFNGKNRQYGAVLNHQETTNGHFVQSITKKRKLNDTYSSAASEWLSGRHPGELEVERQRKLTRGKAVEDQLVFPKFEQTQRDNLPRYEASKEHVVKASIKKKSKSSKHRKVNNNTEYQAQCMVGRALESNAAENSCSSVSSSESFMARKCIAFDKHSLSRPLADSYDGNLESYPPHNMVMSGERQANEVHKLESLAYRSVLKALRARGSLDWQQETLLTDLRLSLHITNDEHRLELTHMCSAQDVQL
jgi:hypothetical protein